jgi:hypothetical protein
MEGRKEREEGKKERERERYGGRTKRSAVWYLPVQYSIRYCMVWYSVVRNEII